MTHEPHRTAPQLVPDEAPSWVTTTDDGDLAGLAAAVRDTAGVVVRRVRHESGSPLTWSQSALLSELSRRGGATASELAVGQNLRVQTVWVSLETMEQRGLVRRERDAGDRRRVRVHLTELGRRELVADREVRDAWLLRVLSEDFSAGERAHLTGALTLLVRLADSDLANGHRPAGARDGTGG